MSGISGLSGLGSNPALTQLTPSGSGQAGVQAAFGEVHKAALSGQITRDQAAMQINMISVQEQQRLLSDVRGQVPPGATPTPEQEAALREAMTQVQAVAMQAQVALASLDKGLGVQSQILRGLGGF